MLLKMPLGNTLEKYSWSMPLGNALGKRPLEILLGNALEKYSWSMPLENALKYPWKMPLGILWEMSLKKTIREMFSEFNNILS